jgi:hypothetical protein
MSTIKIATLMERLRIQSILQRLIKAQGRDQALATVLEAIALEFPASINTRNETPGKRNTASTTARS